MNNLKWKVAYIDYYGNENIIAAFAWLSDAEKYITENQSQVLKVLEVGRLRIEENE